VIFDASMGAAVSQVVHVAHFRPRQAVFRMSCAALDSAASEIGSTASFGCAAMAHGRKGQWVPDPGAL
jgi:hypothetical protein